MNASAHAFAPDRFTRPAGALATCVTLALLAPLLHLTPDEARTRESPRLAAEVVEEALQATSTGAPRLFFEANLGQVDDPAVSFLARRAGYTIGLREGGATFALAPSPGTLDVFRMKFEGIDPASKPEGIDCLSSASHYLRGRDPSAWITHVPHYAKVKYPHAWPGIDIVFYGTPDGRLEYDLVLAPGADVARVAISFDGVERVSLTPDGDLRLQFTGSEFVHQAPIAYQQIEGARVRVPAHYVLLGPNRVGFHVGAHDATNGLVIDPVLVYSTYLGGTGAEEGIAIAVDGGGHAYVTGTSFTGAGFPTTPGAFDTTQNGTTDAFIAKLSPDASSVVYATFLGGSANDRVRAIAVDAAGSAYVVGNTVSPDFPTTPGAFDTTANPNPTSGRIDDAFVTKQSPDGSSLVYSTYLGGTSGDIATGIALDAAGSAYVVGDSGASGDQDFPTTPGAYKEASGPGPGDVFVTKFSPDGSSLVYSTFLRAGGFFGGNAIAVDDLGAAYATGFAAGFLDTSAGGFDTTPNGERDAFVVKLNPTGSAAAYTTYIGGSLNDIGRGIALDAARNAYVTGNTHSTDFPVTPGAFDTTYSGETPASGSQDPEGDAFIAKLSAGGGTLVYATYVGGTADELGAGIRVRDGNAFVAGTTQSADFPTAGSVPDTTFGGGAEAFALMLSSDGSSLVYSTFLGGSQFERGNGLAVGSDGSAYVAGNTNSLDFPVTPGAFQQQKTTAASLSSVAFVSKLEGANEQPPGGAPRAPGNIRCEARNNFNRISWSASPGASQYHVYQKEGSGAFKHVGSTSDSPFDDHDVRAGKTYRYHVVASTSGQGNSPPSQTCEVTAIPFFTTVLAMAVAVLGGVGAYVWMQRKRQAP